MGEALVQSARSAVKDLNLIGPGKASSATGLRWTGRDVEVNDVQIRNFGTGLSAVSQTTYICAFNGGMIYDCGLGLDARLDGLGFTSGERLTFYDTTIAGCDLLMAGSFSALNVYFSQCSLDHPTGANGFGDISENAYFFFAQCHPETRHTDTPGSTLFQKRTGARLAFDQCRFDLYGTPDGPMYRLIIDPASEGTSGGSVRYNQTFAYFTPTGATSQVAAASEQSLFFAAGQSEVQFDSPFVSRTVIASAAIWFHSATPPAADCSPRRSPSPPLPREEPSHSQSPCPTTLS